ncbi:MAG TPA: hypothetical protein VK369_06975 [Segetibacter sp.]|nr:hypothetical protein [Segetibacter sp.]
MRQLLIVILFSLTSCGSSSSDRQDKQKVDKGDILFGDIRKQFDTVPLRLTTEQTFDFVDRWNNSKVKGLYKYLPEYWLTIHFKGDSSISFRTSRDLIKQTNDWTYSVGNKNYFQSLWFKQAGLSDNWFEYLPTYEDEGKFFHQRDSHNDNHKAAIKQVLTYYGHKWKEIRGQIFYEGNIHDELLWNYTMKANDSIWLSSHKR